MVKSGDTILVGGFGMTGHPVHLVHALAETDAKDLTYVANNAGEVGLGGGRLVRTGQLKKAIASFFTSNPEAVAAFRAGTMEVELIPQGTLAEALRAGGAGIGGFFTPTSAGTVIGENRETKVIDGKTHVLIPGLRGNVAFVRAWKADTAGNLVYRMTEQNFNKAMATAADLVIAEERRSFLSARSIPTRSTHRVATSTIWFRPPRHSRNWVPPRPWRRVTRRSTTRA